MVEGYEPVRARVEAAGTGSRRPKRRNTGLARAVHVVEVDDGGM